MFGFLRKKLKDVVDNFSRQAEESAEPAAGVPGVKEEPKPAAEAVEARREAKPEAAEKPVEGVGSALEELREDLGRKAGEIEAAESEGKAKPAGEAKRKGGILGKLRQAVTTTRISDEKFGELFEDFELALLENNVAMEVVEKIRDDLRGNVVNKPIKRGEVANAVRNSLKGSIESLFDVDSIDLVKLVKEKKPFVIMFAGINGSGKTTSIAKIARRLQNNRLKCVIAASDTFRAAAIHQLEEHASRLGVRMIKHDYGSDPAAVAFDAIKYAEAHGVDAVLIDTAGRQHSNANLMAEMKKIVRVAKPDLKIFVGESITGNDCVEQARQFNEAIGIDGIILSKADVDEKGGAAISVSYVTRKPIVYIGTGQEYDDLKPFNPYLVVESLGLAVD